MLERAKHLLRPSARSDVPPFMVMDVMAAAARLEAQGRRDHPHGSRPAGRGRARDRNCRGSRCALFRPARLYRNARYCLAAPTHRTRLCGMARYRYRSRSHRRHTGSSAGFILAFLAAFEAGDRVAMALPGYPPYRHILTALGCEPAGIETNAATRWSMTGEALLAEHRKTPIKGIVVGSPANPSGTMMTAPALSDLISVAEDAGIIVISDEIYHGLDYAFAAESAARISPDAIIVNSFSKYFCMTGWRIGWMVVPPSLVRAVERLQQNLAISVPTLSQIAAEAAFDGRAELEECGTATRKIAAFYWRDCRAQGSMRFCRLTARFISTPTCRGSRPTV